MEMMTGGTYSTTLAAFESDIDVRKEAAQPGCYVLLSVDKTLYVGSSTLSMTSRINDHACGRGTIYLYERLNRAKRCQERLTITLCPTLPEEARRKETELIEAYDPLYNSRQPNTGRY